ncbi:D-sedoheptulose-7-phosphate isomerase [Gordonia sp. DT219]|uniref:D-sedoheptulose-7-phosphate isomerase n=1 Tax=Gordonia sp. DT219 TaxID=3416658 RepID=UPI003CEC3819
MIEQHFAALSRAAQAATSAAPVIRSWATRLADMYAHDGRLLVCGNGGSAAEAQHLTGELVGRFRYDRHPLSAIALHSDGTALTAICNDYGEESGFARQVRAHGRPGDVVFLLSTSGESRNILAAAKAAQEMGLRTWSITGPAPNSLAGSSDENIAVEADTVATVQEIHLMLIHALCLALDGELGVRV